MNKITSVFFLFLIAILAAGNVNAQKLPFQGRLLQNDIPINDTLSITFGIDAINWSEVHSSVIVKDGLYSVVLGEVSPLPGNMFSAASEHELTIDVEGTALSPVKLYPALSSGINSRFSKEGSTMRGDTAIYSEITGGADTLMYSGILSTAKTSGVNVGIRGNAISTAGIANYQVGAWGRAEGEANAFHYGVIGQARGKGPRNLGLYGVASGVGNGATSLDSGSYNQGVFGVGLNNPWGNVGVYGEASGTVGEDNIGVVGWSFVGDENTENKGLLGWAKGTGINKGVMGLATGGAENWAGWFEGDTWFNGKYLNARVDSITINDANNRQAIVLESMYGGLPTAFIGGYGSNGKGNFYLYSAGPDRNYGNLNLKDSTGTTKAWLSAYHLPDGRASGLLSLYGPDQKGWIGTGFKGWDSDSLVNLPYIHLEGNIPNLTLLNGNVYADSLGNESGMLELRTSQNNSLSRLTHDGLTLEGENNPLVQMGAKVWENADLGIISIKDANWTTLASLEATQDVNGFRFGQLNLSGSLDSRTLLLDPNQIILNGTSSPNVQIGSVFWDEANDGLNRGYVNILGAGSQTLIHMRGDFNSGMNRNAGYLEITDEIYDGYINLSSLKDTISSLKVGMSSAGTSVELRGNGDVYATGTFQNISDRRLKENITPVEGALQSTLKLNGVSYYWKDKSTSSEKQIGFIAQEVEQVYPEFVKTNSDGYKSVNYAQMVAVLIEAIKELNTEISQLKAENQGLKAQLDQKIDNMNSRMDLLEKLLQNNTLKADASSNGK